MERADLELVLALAWEVDDRSDEETRALGEVSGWLNDVPGADEGWPEYLRQGLPRVEDVVTDTI